MKGDAGSERERKPRKGRRLNKEGRRGYRAKGRMEKA
jgi:hypothetical protein